MGVRKGLRHVATLCSRLVIRPTEVSDRPIPNPFLPRSRVQRHRVEPAFDSECCRFQFEHVTHHRYQRTSKQQEFRVDGRGCLAVALFCSFDSIAGPDQPLVLFRNCDSAFSVPIVSTKQSGELS